MKKYKLLHFGHCYINESGDLVIGLLHGNNKRGYTFAASSAHPAAFLQNIWIQTRIVPNDGHWTEVSAKDFMVVSQVHIFSRCGNPYPFRVGEELRPNRK
jgi:hypothetical protein